MGIANTRFASARLWAPAATLLVLALLAYQPVWHAGFIWDDESHLTQNPCIVGPLGLKDIWTSTRAVYYPLVLTTFWIVHKFVGLSSSPYHALNILLHGASAALLWRVLRQLRVPGAWLGAALWVLHPVMVQSVAWVTELKNTQSTLFYLLSVLWFLRSDPDVTKGRLLSWRYAGALLFFALAITSKPSTVMLPAVLALCSWWQKERIQNRDILRIFPYVVISLMAAGWTIWEQKFHSGAVGPDWAQTLPERVIIAGRGVWFYLGKLVWPQPLIFIYPRWDIHSSQVTAYLPPLAAFALLLLSWLTNSKWSRSLFFASAYFVVSLLPVLGFFNVYFFRYSFVSDHFQYLASMGPLALGGAGLAKALELSGYKRSFRNALYGAVLLLLGFLTWRQCAIYRDVITLYTATLARNPACWMAHYNLAIALHAEGEDGQAIGHYEQAISLRPNYAEAHYNLGRLLGETGDPDGAKSHYEAALAINPAYVEAHNNVGATLLQSGRVQEAIAHFQKALSLQPDYADASCNLGNALIAQGDLDGAITHYGVCLALSPNQADAQYNLAGALLKTGRIDEAIFHYQKALQLRPEDANVHTNFGSALLAKGRVREAVAQYRDALRFAPANVAAESNLAWLLATSANSAIRNGPESVPLAEEANRLSGRSRPINLRILAAAYAEAGRFKEATETAEQALQLAREQNNSVLVSALENEIALYQSDQPYHQETKQIHERH